jgi:3-dehydroquinate synthase
LVRVTVALPGRSYDVVIGSGILERAAELLPELRDASSAYTVSDKVVADHFFEALATGLKAGGLAPVALTVPTGEEAKSLQAYGTLLHRLAASQAHRGDLVIAMGGGATGDLAGFVASTYMRGLPFVQVPTTLTAQVDAAIGGKNGVNLPEGKNLVGTFRQPVAVLADVGTLTTLPEREYRSGLAEVVKYGLTLDPGLLRSLEEDPSAVMAREPETLEPLVARCVGAKASVVEQDELDEGGRMVLNYGHTLGHALERIDSFGGRSHGEAIAIGMVFAGRLSESIGIAAPGLWARTRSVLASFGLDTDGKLPAVSEIEAAFQLDKKYRKGVRFVLLERIGKPIVVDDVPRSAIRDTLEVMGAAA